MRLKVNSIPALEGATKEATEGPYHGDRGPIYHPSEPLLIE